MNIKNIVILVSVASIISAGGIGGIVIAVIKFLSNYIADNLAKKYENKLERALEKYKSELSKKEYVSKTRFDAEFSIYKELSEKNISMVFEAGEAAKIVQGISYTDDEISSIILRFQNIIDDARLTNTRYAPFINEGIFKDFCLLVEKTNEILSLLNIWNMNRNGKHFSLVNDSEDYHDQSVVQLAIVNKQKEIMTDSNNLLSTLREYLSNLDVEEN